MLLDIAPAKKNPGRKFNFDFLLEADESLLNNNYAKFEGGIAFSGNYYYSGCSVFVYGNIKTAIKYPCDRCLKPVIHKMDIVFEEVFFQESEREEDYTYRGDYIDISKPVNDYVILNLPSSVVCKKSCKGLCPVCGNDLNIKECGCVREEYNPAVNPFSDLLKK